MRGFHELSGQCHCGNIRYRYQSPVPPAAMPVRACQCSFCTRHGARYTSHPRGIFRGEVREERLLTRYRFATATAEFYVCGRCGGVPFVTSEIDGHRYAVININSLADVTVPHSAVSPADFEGESTGDRLDRRRERWIGDVRIDIHGEV